MIDELNKHIIKILTIPGKLQKMFQFQSMVSKLDLRKVIALFIFTIFKQYVLFV